ncbi:MAG: ATPase, T2SS/T4P/T4SS family, partial [Candidatus Nanoarchaeia archaeon]|nr:ATPase, T2SS/T4P/T4SS family [Candidatus Nanoarchaeia archaeon]
KKLILRTIGKKLRRARQSDGGQEENETLVVSRFTTLPVSNKFTDSPYIPYSQQFKGGSNKEVYIVDKEVLKPEVVAKKEEAPKELTINVTKPEAIEEKLDEKIEEEIARKIKQSPFQLKFKTLNINEIKSQKLATTSLERDIRKNFADTFDKSSNENLEVLRAIKKVVPLVTLSQNNENKVVAYATIQWNETDQSINYIVTEPSLNDKEKELLEEIKEMLREKLNIDFEKIKGAQAYTYIIDEFKKIVRLIGIKLTIDEELKFNYFVYRDFIGLGVIEPLMHDPDIEDISCVGSNIPIFVYHKNPLFNQIPTNIMFPSNDELDNFAILLSQKCGKSLTLAEPLLDAALPDGSRVQITYGSKDISRRGSNFTIRKFTDNPLTPTDLMKTESIDADTLAYLWYVIEHNMSMLISGATASGKTTFLNALSLFIRPEFKIVSIEDTAELRLPHHNWIAQTSRQGFGNKQYGEITMFHLLKAGLRQRPDYIILGEVRGEEASVLFQGMASISGDEELFLIDEKNNPVFVAIKDLKNVKKHKAHCYQGFESKILPVNAWTEHKVNNLYEIITKKGRKITVSPEHSLLTYDGKNIIPFYAKEAKKSDTILIPRVIKSGYNDLEYFDLTFLKNIRVLAPDLIKKAVNKLGYEAAGKICKVKSINDYYRTINCSALKYDSFEKLMNESKILFDKKDLTVKFDKKSKQMPALIKITPELLKLLGYYTSEGSLNIAYKNNSISLYNKNKEVLQRMRTCLSIFSDTIKERETKGFGTCTELLINNKVLFELLQEIIGQGSKNKKIPSFIFGLSKEKIGYFLEALYEGDGNLRTQHFTYYTVSKDLANKLALLLNVYGIVSKINYRKDKKIFEIIFSKNKYKKEFLKYVKPLSKIIPITGNEKEDNDEIGDFYLDKIESINKIKKNSAKVYDICVPGAQNFISGFGGIVLHNTGHPALGTIHADNMPAVVDRLTNKPIDLPKTMLENLDIIVFLEKFKIGGKSIRKVKEVVEIVGYDYKNKELISNSAFRWNNATFKFDSFESVILDKIQQKSGFGLEDLRLDMKRRILLLNYLSSHNINDYRTFSLYISRFYTNPSFVENLK